MVDCDLAGLTEDWEIYKENTENIWKEYSQIYTEEQFKNGRIKWLQEFLTKPKIFQTQFFDEEKARNNLKKELDHWERYIIGNKQDWEVRR